LGSRLHDAGVLETTIQQIVETRKRSHDTRALHQAHECRIARRDEASRQHRDSSGSINAFTMSEMEAQGIRWSCRSSNARDIT